MKDIHIQMIESFKFLEAEKHEEELMDYMGDPIPSVSEDTFYKYFQYLTNLLRATKTDLPFDINLCPNRSIDLYISDSQRSSVLLINIKEDEITYYGYERKEEKTDTKYRGFNYFGEIKGKTTSQIPDQDIIEFIKKNIIPLDFSE